MSRRARDNRNAIAGSILVAVPKHNALEGQPDEDWLPDRWDGPQVAKALVAAFATLDRLPDEGGPRGISSAWPEYRREFADAVGLPEDERLAREREQNRSRVPPSAMEVSRMDRCFGWLERLRQVEPNAAVCVQVWCHCRHRRLDWRRVCRRKRIAVGSFYRRREAGLASIAFWLNRRNVAVF